MNSAYIRNIHNLANNDDYDMDSTAENDIMKMIDDAETFVSGVQDSRANNDAYDNDAEHDGDNLSDASHDSGQEQFGHGLNFDSSYFENSKKINQTINYFGTGDEDDLDEFDDEKDILIDDIETMLEVLNDAQFDISKLPVVTEKNKLSEIKAAHKKIKRKHDKLTYSELGGHIIMGVCHTLETVFNGRRNLFGYRPSLQGWTEKLVRGSLPRMKRESANLVSEKIESYGFTEFSKIMITLVPGMLVYAATSRPTGDGTNVGDDVDARQRLGDRWQ